MVHPFISDLIRTKKNFVFIGEAGCGKTEIAVNFALSAAQAAEPGRELHFFDLDQTKPLFRSRDLSERMETAHIRMHSQEQLLETPLLVSGVTGCLRNPGQLVFLDVGGDVVGSRVLAQFAHLLRGGDSYVFFVVNPFRPWSADTQRMRDTMRAVLAGAGVQSSGVIGNPNLGLSTTAEDVLAGSDRLREMLAGEGTAVDCVCARGDLLPALQGRLEEPVVPLELHITYPWQ